MGLGKVSKLEVAVSAVLLYASIIITGLIAAKIYRMGTLRYGNPIKITTALKEIKLSDREKKYNDSLIFKSYPLDTLPVDELVNDLDDLIEIYKTLLVSSGLKPTVPFQRPPRSKNEKRERFIIENLKFTPGSTIEDDSNPNNDDSDPNDMETPKFEPTQKIFFGTPGGGKSFRVKKFIEEERNAKGRYFRVTFHPDTDYASFVGSYKPIMKGNEITYEYVPQVFTRAYIAAWNDPKNEYFIDIEEINRGNCAQIFGDLFQLLDRKSDTGLSEYPVKADADLCNYLVNAVDKDGNPILKNKDGIKTMNCDFLLTLVSLPR